MANHRTPLAKAKLTGAAAKNPQRFRERFEPVEGGPVGKAPAFLSESEREAWDSFASEWSWLTSHDRVALVALVQMRTVAEDRLVEKNAAFYTAYRLLLAEFGGTPVSRSKVHAPKNDDDDDPFAQFGVQ